MGQRLFWKSLYQQSHSRDHETKAVSTETIVKARFKRSATAVPNSIDRIKFDFSTAVARCLKPSRATAV